MRLLVILFASLNLMADPISESGEFWLVGDYPVLDSIVYGAGSGKYQEVNQDQSNYGRTNFKYLESAGVSVLVGSPAAIQVPLSAYLVRYMQTPKFSSKRSAILEELSNMINMELVKTQNGAEFIDMFGSVVSIELSDEGFLKRIETSEEISFEAIQTEDLIFFKASIAGKKVSLFIEPNLILE